MTAEDVCSECGERNPPNSAFCVFCGAYLGWDERDVADEETTRIVVPPVPEQPQRVLYAPPPSSVTPPPQEQATRRMEAVPAGPSSVPPTGQASESTTCPSCGTPTAPGRYFCGKCGQPLRPAHLRAPSEPPTTQPLGWWQRFRDPSARAARRSYRHSLVWWRRWRRVAFGVLALVLVGGGVFALKNNAIHDIKDLITGSSSPSKTVNTGKSPTTPHGSSAVSPPFRGQILSTDLRNKAHGVVKQVQRRLQHFSLYVSPAGRKYNIDGIYGDQTAAAVTAFQKANGLPQTGKVDRATWDKLFARTKP